MTLEFVPCVPAHSRLQSAIIAVIGVGSEFAYYPSYPESKNMSPTVEASVPLTLGLSLPHSPRLSEGFFNTPA